LVVIEGSFILVCTGLPTNEPLHLPLFFSSLHAPLCAPYENCHPSSISLGIFPPQMLDFSPSIAVSIPMILLLFFFGSFHLWLQAVPGLKISKVPPLTFLRAAFPLNFFLLRNDEVPFPVFRAILCNCVGFSSSFQTKPLLP